MSDTPRCVIEAAHARWLAEARPVPRTEEGMLIGWPEMSRALRVDPDGPLEPMRPAAVWQREGERRAERVYREARDAALIAAIGKLWG